MEAIKRDEMIKFILLAVENSHNDKDKIDLLTFSNEEIIEIYNDIIELTK
jgi:hypothetical protein